MSTYKLDMHPATSTFGEAPDKTRQGPASTESRRAGMVEGQRQTAAKEKITSISSVDAMALCMRDSALGG